MDDRVVVGLGIEGIVNVRLRENVEMRDRLVGEMVEDG